MPAPKKRPGRSWNRSELSWELAQRARERHVDVTSRQVERVLAAFEELIAETLADGYSVYLQGFGRFLAVTRAARMGVNPRTGEKVPIPAKRHPKFIPGSILKAAVKEGSAPD